VFSIRQKKNGFTLVELLVVIAIIALLMSVLIPALGRAREQAKTVACQSNLKQWGTFFSMYSNDYDGVLFEGWWGSNVEDVWCATLQDYYRQEELLFCPKAKKVINNTRYGTKTTAWQLAGVPGIGRENIAGSYGINSWVLHYADTAQPSLGQWAWKTTNVNGGNNIPLVLDSTFAIQYPHFTDEPPEFDGEWYLYGMKKVCINRHTFAINVVFLDCTVRKVGLKGLWKLKWHRKFELDGPWTTAGGMRPNDWPAWMRSIPDE